MSSNSSTVHGIKTDHTAFQDITRILDEQATGWNNGDALTYSKAFAEDGCFTNIFGMYHEGYDEFFRKHKMILEGVFKGSAFEYKVSRFKFATDELAIVETLITVSNFSKSGAFNKIYTDKNGRLITRLLQVFQKEEDQWKIIAYHNIDIKEGIPVPELQ